MLPRSDGSVLRTRKICRRCPATAVLS